MSQVSSSEPQSPPVSERASAPAASTTGIAPWSALVAAVEFLTRIALPQTMRRSPQALARMAAYFPLVGALIGAFTATVAWAACQVWPVWLAVLVALSLEAWLTGALHEDAVADFCDAFGGGWTREDVLAILKDSRLGTYGALGLGLAVATRAGAMMELIGREEASDAVRWICVFMAAGAAGRWTMVLLMAWLPPVAGRESLSQDVAGRLSRRDFVMATLWLAPLAVWFGWQSPLHAALAGVAVLSAVAYFARLVKRRLGGVTGDCLGCIGYLAQLIVLLAAAVRWPV